jgi:hypothetical protein
MRRLPSMFWGIVSRWEVFDMGSFKGKFFKTL